MERVVVESRNVLGLPKLVLETFPELVLENVVVSTLQKRDHLLLLRLSHHLEVELRQSTLNHTRKERPLSFYISIFLYVLTNEVFLSLQHIH